MKGGAIMAELRRRNAGSGDKKLFKTTVDRTHYLNKARLVMRGGVRL